MCEAVHGHFRDAVVVDKGGRNHQDVEDLVTLELEKNCVTNGIGTLNIS